MSEVDGMIRSTSFSLPLAIYRPPFIIPRSNHIASDLQFSQGYVGQCKMNDCNPLILVVSIILHVNMDMNKGLVTNCI